MAPPRRCEHHDARGIGLSPETRIEGRPASAPGPTPASWLQGRVETRKSPRRDFHIPTTHRQGNARKTAEDERSFTINSRFIEATKANGDARRGRVSAQTSDGSRRRPSGRRVVLSERRDLEHALDREACSRSRRSLNTPRAKRGAPRPSCVSVRLRAFVVNPLPPFGANWTIGTGEGTIEFIFELLFQLILEVLAQILFELATALGWESLKDSMRSERESTPLLSGIGHFLMGLCAGVGSVLVFGSRVTPRSPIPGLSLVLSPIVTGLAMDRIGESWRERGWDRPALFSFRAGAIFAFAMALVRFVYLEVGWSPL